MAVGFGVHRRNAQCIGVSRQAELARRCVNLTCVSPRHGLHSALAVQCQKSINPDAFSPLFFCLFFAAFRREMIDVDEAMG